MRIRLRITLAGPALTAGAGDVLKLHHNPDALRDRVMDYARNARTHDDDQVAKIAVSIVEFGWMNPVLIDETSSRDTGGSLPPASSGSTPSR